MDTQGWNELLNHLRKRVIEARLSELDDLITSDFRTSSKSSHDVLRYLRLLISALNERSRRGYQRTLSILRESVASESGQPIGGIEIAVVSADQPLYQTEGIDLANVGNYDALTNELERIYQGLLEESESDIEDE